jgi:antitoxin (DNA-binding transcriptional repressor) of toxin-antitoxin stability system
MKRIAVQELREHFPRVLESARREPIAITRGGKVCAAIVAFDELDFEAYSLGRNSKFAEIINRSRVSGRRYGLVALESLEKELRLPRRRQSPRRSQ